MDNPNNASQPDAGISDVAPVVTPVANVDTSQGFPVSPEEVNPPLTEPTGTSQPATEPTNEAGGDSITPEPSEAPVASEERLKQQNAQQVKLLDAVGIDALSDMGEQLEQGLITKEMVRDHVRSKYQTPQTPTAPETSAPATNDPVALAETEVKAADEAYAKEIADTGQVSLAVNDRVRKADRSLYDARLKGVTQQIAADKQFEQVNQSVNAVKAIAREGAAFANMDAPLQNTVEEATLSLTGAMADKWARENGINPANLTTAQYQHFGNEATKQLGGLAEYYTNLGREQAKAGFVPNPSVNPNPPPNANVNVNANMPVPANAAGSPVPVNNPYAHGTIENHKDLAKQYMKQNRAVV